MVPSLVAIHNLKVDNNITGTTEFIYLILGILCKTNLYVVRLCKINTIVDYMSVIPIFLND